MKVFVSFILVFLLSVDVYADNIELGRSIYNKGIGRDGREITAKVHGQVVMQGATVACVNCHGKDARGGGESFVKAPDIRWLTLTKKYAARYQGNTRKPYNKSRFITAISRGVNTEGDKLDLVMPRFSLANDEVDALQTYLNSIGEELTNQESTPVILSLMPESSGLAEKIIYQLQSCNNLDAGTKIPFLDVITYTNPSDAKEKLENRLRQKNIVYLLSPFIAGWEEQYISVIEKYNIPTFLPLSSTTIQSSDLIKARWASVEEQFVTIVSNVSQHIMLLYNEKITPAWLVANIKSLIKEHEKKLITNDKSYKGQDKISYMVLSPLDSLDSSVFARVNKVSSNYYMPVVFFDYNQARKISNTRQNIVWNLSYPYNPVIPGLSRKKNLAEAIGQAGCLIMSNSMDKKKMEKLLSTSVHISMDENLQEISFTGKPGPVSPVVIKKFSFD